MTRPDLLNAYIPNTMTLIFLAGNILLPETATNYTSPLSCDEQPLTEPESEGLLPELGSGLWTRVTISSQKVMVCEAQVTLR